MTEDSFYFLESKQLSVGHGKSMLLVNLINCKFSFIFIVILHV